MEIECTGRQVTITGKLRTVAEEGIDRIGKVLGRITGAHVVLTTEKHRHIAEVTVKTRACNLVALCESTLGIENVLREALAKAEAQAVRHRNKMRTQKRQPKEEKQLATLPGSNGATAAARPKAASANQRSNAPGSGLGGNPGSGLGGNPGNGKSRAQAAVPVTVHSFPARGSLSEPHIVHSADAVALRPMTLEEAVKEAEFRDREVFVFRDNQGKVKVLHRKRDGKMELIEAP